MGDSSARYRRRKRGQATYRLVRYADDFVVLVKGGSQSRPTPAAGLALNLGYLRSGRPSKPPNSDPTGFLQTGASNPTLLDRRSLQHLLEETPTDSFHGSKADLKNPALVWPLATCGGTPLSSE